jgi:hypothetical protein
MTDKVIGRATAMGWKRRKSGDKFRIEIELDGPPQWPINVVWKSTPITLTIMSENGEAAS